MGLFFDSESSRQHREHLEREREIELLRCRREEEAHRLLLEGCHDQREILHLLRKQTNLLVLIESDLRYLQPARLTGVRLVFSKPYSLSGPQQLVPPLSPPPIDLLHRRMVPVTPSLQQIVSQPSTSSPSSILPPSTPTPATQPAPVPLGATPMPTPGPISLVVGQSVTASLLYLDQAGNPMPATFTPPVATFAVDTPTVLSSTPDALGQTDTISAILAGTSGISVVIVSAEGLTLTDATTATVTDVVPPPAVLSSVKLQFGTPTP